MKIPTEKLAANPIGRLYLQLIAFWRWLKFPAREVWCRRCRAWHPVLYARDNEGRLSDVLMGASCGKYYLVALNGKAIDGHQIRRAK